MLRHDDDDDEDRALDTSELVLEFETDAAEVGRGERFEEEEYCRRDPSDG